MTIYKKKKYTREWSFRDAKKPLTIHVTWEDIKGAIPGDGRNCVISRAVRREHNCFDAVLHRTVAYVRKGENSVPLRYQINRATHDTLVAWDASGRSRPITVTFQPPRYAMSQEYRSTNGYKQRKRKSAAKSKERKTRLRRAYTKVDPLTLLGVRNGTGARPLGQGKLR